MENKNNIFSAQGLKRDAKQAAFTAGGEEWESSNILSVGQKRTSKGGSKMRGWVFRMTWSKEPHM